MVKKSVQATKPAETEVFGIGALADLSECGACGFLFNGESFDICPFCRGKGKPEPVAEKPKETEKAVNHDAVITCHSCGTVFDPSFREAEDGNVFDGVAEGVHCPSCNSVVLDGQGKAVAEGNPDGKSKDPDFDGGWG